MEVTSNVKETQKSLVEWGKQEWGTKSGEPSSKTGERYLPEKAREALSDSEYAATSARKEKIKLPVSNTQPNLKRLQRKQQSLEWLKVVKPIAD